MTEIQKDRETLMAYLLAHLAKAKVLFRSYGDEAAQDMELLAQYEAGLKEWGPRWLRGGTARIAGIEADKVIPEPTMDDLASVDVTKSKYWPIAVTDWGWSERDVRKAIWVGKQKEKLYKKEA